MRLRARRVEIRWNEFCEKHTTPSDVWIADWHLPVRDLVAGRKWLPNQHREPGPVGAGRFFLLKISPFGDFVARPDFSIRLVNVGAMLATQAGALYKFGRLVP